MNEKKEIDTNELKAAILEIVLAPNYQPVKPKVIARKLRMADQAPVVRKAVKALIRAKRVEWGRNHIVRPVVTKAKPVAKSEAHGGEAANPSAESFSKSDSPENTGVFSRAAAGYGFVRVHGTPRSEKKNDIFVPAPHTLDAADGDTVRFEITSKKSGEGRIRGKLLEVLDRGRNQFVGTYLEKDGSGYVKVDGGQFDQPILVGDAGAKNAKAEDKVVIEMVSYPSYKDDGEGVIVEVLGARGTPGVDTLGVMREYGLPETFPEDVLESARQQAEAFDEEVGDRRDLTADTIITIDPKDARDFDDAISLEKIENGHWRLGVHIADVSHFVPENSPLDLEARDRATSVYLPDRVIPMLPEIISNNLASLQPDRVRYAKTVFIEFTADGAPVDAEFVSTAIRSKHRFNYEEIDDYLADSNKWKDKLTPEVHSLVGRMHELAMMLRKRRFAKGALELTLPDIKVDLDNDGRVSGAHLVENTESHQMIEEFMLAANIAVAELLRKQELHFLRRIHEPPNRKKLKALTSFVRDLGIECENLEDRFEIQKVIREVGTKPERHAVNFSILRSMQKAVYSPADEGHYALAADTYAHFTSPIRRYPDLTVHRMLWSLEKGKRPPNDLDAMLNIGDHCSEREQRAEGAERDLIKIKLLTFLAKKKGEKMQAVITGVEDFGLFAQGLDLPAEGLIHVTTLDDDHYQYDGPTHSLVGHRAGNSFRLGDIIEVEIAEVDIDNRKLDFRLVRTVKKTPRIEKPGGKKNSNRSRKNPSSSPSSVGKFGKGKEKGKSKKGKGGKKKR